MSQLPCQTNNLISKITQVIFEELRLIGGVATDPITTDTDTTDPFQHSVELPPDVPNIETVRITLTKTEECGTDSNGVIYWGNFEVQANEIYARAIVSTDPVPSSWVSSLSQSQISTIEGSITPYTQTDIFDINVTGIGAQYFCIVLPYKETSIQTPGGTVTEEFFSIDATLSTFQQFQVTVNPSANLFSIQGGDIGGISPLLRLTDISHPARLVYSVSAEVTSTNLNVYTIESLDREIFFVRDGFFSPNIPTSYYSTRLGYSVDDTNVYLKVEKKANFDTNPAGVPSDAGTVYGVLSVAGLYTTYSLQCVAGTQIILTIDFAGATGTTLFSIVRGSNLSSMNVSFQSLAAGGNVSITGTRTSGSSYSNSFQYSSGDTLEEIAAMISDSSFVSVTFSGEGIKHLLSDYLINTVSLSGTSVNITGNLPAKNEIYTYNFNRSYSIDSLFFDILRDMTGTHGWVDLRNTWKDFSALHLEDATWNMLSTTTSPLNLRSGWINYGDQTFSLATYPTLGNLASAITSWGVGLAFKFTASSSMSYYNSLSSLSLADVPLTTTTVTLGAPHNFLFNGVGEWTTNESYILASYTISELAQQINIDFDNIVGATVLSSGGSTEAAELEVRTNTSFVNTNIVLSGDLLNLFQISTNLNQSVSSLVSWINSNCNSNGVTASVITPVLSCSGLNAYDDDFNLSTHIFDGQVPNNPPSSLPQHNIELFFNVRFATTVPSNAEAGLQVAYGGFNSNGTLTAYNAPNTFYEPVYNILFPIEFVSQSAQIAYVIVRSRQNLEGTEFSSSGSYGGFPNYELNYIGSAQFSNGAPNEVLQAFVPTDPAQVAAWTDLTAFTPGGVPAVFAIPMHSSLVEVTLEDRGVTPPLTVQFSIINAPSAFDQFGFLGVNRTNQANSQTESRDATAYGLVLDNRGAWDVLIAPEAHLQKVTNGDFSHMNSSYDRTIYDADEGFDFTFNDITAIPSSIRNAISLSPVPNYPQVWVLRIEPAVKQYLAGLRESAPAGSNVGCQLTVDMLVTGRTTGVRGVARVVIYYDYTCVYDVGLCDYFWNLQDPPQPNGPEIIQNQLEILYQPLVDCDALNNGGSNGGNVELDIVWLTRIHHVPTFPNGNALLLMKSHLTSEIDGFFMPSIADLEGLRFEATDPQTGECPLLSSDTEIMRFLNREVLVVRQGNGETYVTDPVEIQSRIQTESAYIWIKPVYNFPPVDSIKDCGTNELVVVGMGFQFKNWLNGQRNYAVVTGAHLLLPTGVYAPPEIDVCFRYYYNQRES